MDEEADVDTLEVVDEFLKRIRSLQLQALHEMGSVRMVDRELAEGFSAEFIRLSTILCEDLTKSLRAHQERIMSASKELESGLLRHLDTPLLSIHGRAVRCLVQKFQNTVTMNSLLPLFQLEEAREDVEVFLQQRLQSVCTHQETQKLLTALVERLSNLHSGIWRVVKSARLSDPAVSIRVLAALVGTQPLVVNYHSGVLEGVAGRLGLAVPGVSPTPTSAPEGMLRRFMASLEQAVSARSFSCGRTV